jgi:AraC-like DNA-binding protein
VFEQSNRDRVASADSDAFDARASQCHVSTAFVRALAGVVQQRGISPETLFGSETAAVYAEPAERSIPLSAFQSLFSRAICLTRDPALGLHCGLQASESSFGLMSPLVAHAPTLRHALALALAAQFQPLLSDGVRIRLTEHMGVAQLRCDLDCDVARNRSFVEFVVAGLLRTVQAFGCAKSDIRAVCFAHARPAYYHAYAVVCAGAERFGQSFTSIEFAAQALDRPHLHRHSELHKLMLGQAERSLERLWRPLSCTERVRALLDRSAISELPEMATAARALGLSARSLRRRLDEEGTSYRELTQSALHESACSLLRNPALTLQSVAYELGFADATAFHRAFRRWANLTPIEYRTAYLGASHVDAGHHA